MPAMGTRWYVVGVVWLALASLARGEFIPLTAPQGHCEGVLATPHPGDQFYLIVGSLAEAAHTTRIKVRTEAADGPEFLPLEKSEPDLTWKIRVGMQARLLERQRRQRPALDPFPPCAFPPTTKRFHLFTGARDLENPSNYQEVHADLHTVGRLGQVYVDRDDKNVPGLDATIAEALRVFDQDIYPWAEKNLGRVLDVDRDGRFTILVTGRLGKMEDGKVQVDGFVRGSDFFRDLPAPFSNRCDMLYLNAALKPGPHLRTVLAHEFTHAVTFCEHALTSYQKGPSNLDEESWLNEGLSHLIENRHGFGWSNLEHRISTFLSQTASYPLVVPDYFAAGQWRNPGLRGAAFLFLRSCAFHADAELTRRLIQSPLHGIANLEAAARTPFPDMFRQATVDFLDRQNYGYLDKDQTGPLLCGPRFQAIPLDQGQGESTVAGTAATFFLLHSPAGPYARLRVDSTGPVQVTLVRVPTAVPRLSLRWIDTGGTARLEITAHHGAVVLRGAGWEVAAATGQLLPNSAIPFACDRLLAGQAVTSAPLLLPAGNEFSERVFKVLGEDARRHPVAAWIGWPVK